mmetsp:Transcript_128456/g.363565  ORF Transcript_128456/g.363565 Transcript_128456/m.363565 type:complete len:255 (+) Transcript_128456:384-1148(+)
MDENDTSGRSGSWCVCTARASLSRLCGSSSWSGIMLPNLVFWSQPCMPSRRSPKAFGEPAAGRFAAMFSFSSASSGSSGTKRASNSCSRPTAVLLNSAHAWQSSGTPLAFASASVRRTHPFRASATSRTSPAWATATTTASWFHLSARRPGVSRMGMLGAKITLKKRGRQGCSRRPLPKAWPSISAQASSHWKTPLRAASTSVRRAHPLRIAATSRTSPTLAVATGHARTSGRFRTAMRGANVTQNHRRPAAPS